MKNKKTFIQKLSDNRKWFIPFYSCKEKAMDEGVGKILTNAIASATLIVATGALVGGYSIRTLSTGKFSLSKQNVVYAQRDKEQQHISELRENLCSHIDQNKDNKYSLTELTDFCEKTGQDPSKMHIGYSLTELDVNDLEKPTQAYESREN